MTLFDLLFLVSFLVAAVTLVVVAVLAIRGRHARSYALLRRLGIGAAAYFSVLLLVSAFTPQRFLALGNEQCSDDWCITAQTAHRDSTNTAVRYDVTFRLANHARRVAQRERFVAVHLRDERGRQYAPVTEPSAVPFDTLLQAGETLTAVRRFLVPTDAAGITGLVIERAGGGRFPRCCIIGDEGSFFHRRTIVKLD